MQLRKSLVSATIVTIFANKSAHLTHLSTLLLSFPAQMITNTAHWFFLLVFACCHEAMSSFKGLIKLRKRVDSLQYPFVHTHHTTGICWLVGLSCIDYDPNTDEPYQVRSCPAPLLNSAAIVQKIFVCFVNKVHQLHVLRARLWAGNLDLDRLALALRSVVVTIALDCRKSSITSKCSTQRAHVLLF